SSVLDVVPLSATLTGAHPTPRGGGGCRGAWGRAYRRPSFSRATSSASPSSALRIGRPLSRALTASMMAYTIRRTPRSVPATSSSSETARTASAKRSFCTSNYLPHDFQLAVSRDRPRGRFRPRTRRPSSGGHCTVQNVFITQPSEVRFEIPFRGQVILAIAGVPHNVDGFPCTPRPLIGTLD